MGATPNRSPLPLGRYPLIATSDLEHAASVYAQVGSPLVVEQTDRRTPFAWNSNRVSFGSFSIFAHEHGGSIRATAPVPAEQFSVSFPLDDATGQAHEGTDVRHAVALARGRETFLSSPRGPQTFHFGTGYRGLRLAFDRATVHAALAALMGATANEVLHFEPRLSLEGGVGASLERMVRFLAQEADHVDGLLTAPLVAARFSDVLLTTLLLGHAHNYTGTLSKVGRPAEPRYVRLAAEHLAAHAAEPLRMTDLAMAMGVSLRALQLGFHRHRGQSPSEFLRDRRLELARTLLRGEERVTVAEVARRCGFESMGHFSARYRARYGELPSRTAKTAR